MDRGAVQEHAEAAVGGFGDLVHAEEAAHRFAHFAVRPVGVADDEHDRDHGGERQRLARERGPRTTSIAPMVQLKVFSSVT